MSSQTKKSAPSSSSSTASAETTQATSSGSNELALMGFADPATAGLMEGLGVLDLYEATMGAEAHSEGGDESLWDQGVDLVAGAGQSLLDFFNPATSAQDLLAWVQEVGEERAQSVLDGLAIERPSVICELLEFAPITHALLQASSRVEEAVLQGVFARLDATRLAQIMGAAAKANLSRALAHAVLGASGPVLLDSLRMLDGADIGEWIAATTGLDTAFLNEALAESWPQGVGVAMTGEIAATFGVPIKLGAGLEAEISHIGDGKLKLKRKGEMSQGVDVGAGGGFHAGLGEKDEVGKVGFGGEVGANLEVGIKEIIEQEFEFPVFKDLAFLSLASSCVMLDAPISLALELEGILLSLSSVSYNTKSRAEFVQHNEGSVGGSAGLRTSNENTESSFRNKKGSDANGGEKSMFWQVLAGLDGKIRAMLDESCWMEQRITETKEIDGVDRPYAGEIEIGAGTQALGEIVANVPELPVIAGLDNLLSHSAEGTMQAKAIWKFTNDDGLAVFLDPSFESVIGGKVDGVGLEVGIGEQDLATGPVTIDEFIDNLTDSTVAASIALGSELGQSLSEMALIAADVKTLLGVEEPGVILTADGKIDFKGTIAGPKLQDIAREMVKAGGYVGSDGGKELWSDFQDVFSGKAPSHLATAAYDVAQALLETETTLDFAAKVGVKLGGKAKAAAGAKVALEGGAGLFLTYERSLYELLGEKAKLNVDDLHGIVTGNAIQGATNVEVQTE